MALGESDLPPMSAADFNILVSTIMVVGVIWVCALVIRNVWRRNHQPPHVPSKAQLEEAELRRKWGW